MPVIYIAGLCGLAIAGILFYKGKKEAAIIALVITGSAVIILPALLFLLLVALAIQAL